MQGVYHYVQHITGNHNCTVYIQYISGLYFILVIAYSFLMAIFISYFPYFFFGDLCGLPAVTAIYIYIGLLDLSQSYLKHTFVSSTNNMHGKQVHEKTMRTSLKMFQLLPHDCCESVTRVHYRLQTHELELVSWHQRFVYLLTSL